jgi:hypothetical protein
MKFMQHIVYWASANNVRQELHVHQTVVRPDHVSNYTFPKKKKKTNDRYENFIYFLSS